MKESYSTRSETAARYSLHPATITRKLNEAHKQGYQISIGSGRGMRINDRVFDSFMNGGNIEKLQNNHKA